jgi:recombination protein RecT
MIELAWRSKEIRSIQARVVFEGDIFEYEYGIEDSLRHIPNAKGPYGERTLSHAYAIVKYIRGGHDFLVLDSEEVAFYRAKSRASSESYSPWQQFPAGMWRKTAVRRLSSEMPLTPEASNEFARDEARDMGTDLGETLPALEDSVDANTENKE